MVDMEVNPQNMFGGESEFSAEESKVCPIKSPDTLTSNT
jgi:hypothetical protein